MGHVCQGGSCLSAQHHDKHRCTADSAVVCLHVTPQHAAYLALLHVVFLMSACIHPLTLFCPCQGKCVCYAGFTGSACDTKTSRPNECNSVVGVNLEPLRDWAHSWTFVDVMKTGRSWISQVRV